MIIVNYKSKRELKKYIGEPLKCVVEGQSGFLPNRSPIFVTNSDNTFKATVLMENGLITSVR